jgi:hypothetical protein
MSQETDATLRKSLDAVDRHQKRLIWSAGAVAMFLAILAFTQLQGQSSDVRKSVGASMFVMAFWTSGWSLVIVLQITVATKRILRAIELTSKSQK